MPAESAESPTFIPRIISRSMNTRRALLALKQGHPDPVNIELFRKHQEVLGRINDSEGLTTDIAAELSAIVKAGVNRFGIHFDRLSGMYAQIRNPEPEKPEEELIYNETKITTH